MQRQHTPATENVASDFSPGIDLVEAARFLTLLDPTATKFDFRTFDDNKAREDKKLTWARYGTLPQYANQLKRLNSLGAGVFVTINETDGKGRETENITRVRAPHIDLDGTPLDKVRTAKVQPHIVVASSPGKFHCHWLVNGMPLENFSLVQEALIETFNSDPKVKALAGVMRLPGFYHNKAEPPFLVRIVDTLDNVPPYPASTFRLAKRRERVAADDDFEINVDKVIDALDAATNPDVDEETWYRLMASALNGSGGAQEALDAFNRWSAKSTAKHNKARNDYRWEMFRKKPPTDIGPGTLYKYANETAPGWRERAVAAAEAMMVKAYADAIKAKYGKGGHNV